MNQDEGERSQIFDNYLNTNTYPKKSHSYLIIKTTDFILYPAKKHHSLEIILNTYEKLRPLYDNYVTKEDMVGFVKEAVAFARIYGKKPPWKSIRTKRAYSFAGNCTFMPTILNPVCYHTERIQV